MCDERGGSFFSTTKQSARQKISNNARSRDENQKQMIKEIFGSAGLPWSQQGEWFVSECTALGRISHYSAYNDPIRPASKWRDELRLEGIGRKNAIVCDASPAAMFRVIGTKLHLHGDLE